MTDLSRSMAKVPKKEKKSTRILFRWHRHACPLLRNHATEYGPSFEARNTTKNSREDLNNHTSAGGRIYLTESMGGMLGANVMRDHNIVFDYDNHLMGFADGACDYHAISKGPDGASAGAEVNTTTGCACMCAFLWFHACFVVCLVCRSWLKPRIAMYFHHGYWQGTS